MGDVLEHRVRRLLPLAGAQRFQGLRDGEYRGVHGMPAFFQLEHDLGDHGDVGDRPRRSPPRGENTSRGVSQNRIFARGSSRAGGRPARAMSSMECETISTVAPDWSWYRLTRLRISSRPAGWRRPAVRLVQQRARRGTHGRLLHRDGDAALSGGRTARKWSGWRGLQLQSNRIHGFAHALVGRVPAGRMFMLVGP